MWTVGVVVTRLGIRSVRESGVECFASGFF